jgi:hypothetical protein
MSKEKNPMRQRAGRKSRNKGNNNERDLAAKFKAYWGWGEWARTPLSGGWATASAREAFRTCGDIITTAADFIFVVEGKKCEGWTLDQLIHNDKCIILSWWKQAEEETPKGMVPLLVIARNHIPHAVVFNASWFKVAFPHAYNRTPGPPWMDYPHFVLDHGFIKAVEEPSNYVFMSLENFFKIDPKYFGRKELMPTKDEEDTAPGRPNPADRPSVPEPVIPTCASCGQPMTRCKCTDNDLRK